jgi:hypothetical protein
LKKEICKMLLMKIKSIILLYLHCTNSEYNSLKFLPG